MLAIHSTSPPEIGLGVDVDGYHIAAHDRNFPYSVGCCRSVVELTGKDIRAMLEITAEFDPWAWWKRKLRITRWFPVRKRVFTVKATVLYPYVKNPLPHNRHTVNFMDGGSDSTAIGQAKQGGQLWFESSAIQPQWEVDVVVGGPPCQGFSFMGLRDLRDPRNSLIDHFVRLVLEVKPKFFVMENVPGLIAGQMREVLAKLLDTAAESGYRVTTPIRMLDASEFGVPQKRRRVFILGARSDMGVELPYPKGRCQAQPERPTVVEAIGDLPDIERHVELLSTDKTSYDKQPNSTYAKVARGLQPDPSDLSIPRGWNRSVCSGCQRINHSEQSVRLYSATRPGESVPGHKLPRLGNALYRPRLPGRSGPLMNISRATLDDKPHIPAHLVTRVCQIGQGAQTCSYLCHQGGWACAKGSNFQKVIDAKRASPEGMKAMGNNCSGPPDFIPTITTITE